MQRRERSRSVRRMIGCLASGLCLLIGAPSALAADGDPESRDETPADGEIRVEGAEPARLPPGSTPGLDALLQLPSGYTATAPDAVAGAGENEWRRRFVKTERELAAAKQSLEATKRELDEVAGEGGGSQWSIAAPGASSEGGPGTSPMSFKLRQQLREDRDKIEVREKALRDLRIEADLAGVPQSWRVAKSQAAGSARDRD